MIRLCSGVDYRPLGRAASEWIVVEGKGGAGEGPVTKVERRRLPERSFAQDRRPFSGNKLWAPNCLCRLYLRYASAAAATDFLLQDPRGEMNSSVPDERQWFSDRRNDFRSFITCCSLFSFLNSILSAMFTQYYAVNILQ